MPSSRIRVYLADDHPLFLRGIAEEVSRRLELGLVGQAGRLGQVAIGRRGLAIALLAVSALRRVARCGWRIVVFSAAVFAVHQLCDLLAYGSDAGVELDADGDHYVAAGAVVAFVLVTISLGGGLLRLLAARRGRRQPAGGSVPLGVVWVGWTLALVAGFCALEGLEIVFEPHHVGGVVGVLGTRDGGRCRRRRSWAP